MYSTQIIQNGPILTNSPTYNYVVHGLFSENGQKLIPDFYYTI